MKIQIEKKKFLRNIIICIIFLIIALLIVNTAPGYRRDKYTDRTNLVIGDTNVTEQLKHLIYINEKGTIYISQDDIATLFDSNIYYDETYKKIVTTSETKVATLQIDSNQMTVNDAKLNIYDGAIVKDEIKYIPISEMDLVYNISVTYIPETDVVIIDRLNNGYIKADVAEDSIIRFKPRALSKEVGELLKGEKVSCYYTTSKGWRLIRTETGTLGYVKANTLANEYIVRQDMLLKEETATISLNSKNIITLNGENIRIQKLFKISKGSLTDTEQEINTGENAYSLWATIDCNTTNLNDYAKRTEVIDNIIAQAMKYNIKGININFTDNKNTKRFIIELAPRLREIGIKTNIVLNGYVDEKEFIGIVDYLIQQ